MRRIRVEIGAILMLLAMILSDGALLLGIYFLSAALHECGHLIAARALGIGIREVRFDFSGVRICTEDGITSYGSELILAAAGPLVNLLAVSASVCFFYLRGVPSNMAVGALMELLEGEFSFFGAVGFFAASSVLQGGINLLPINTLDGGRMLFCVTALFFGEGAACAAIRITSFAAAVILWTVALYLLLRVSAGLGILVFSACVFASTVNWRNIK